MAVFNTQGRGHGHYPGNLWNNSSHNRRGMSNNNFNNNNFSNNFNNNNFNNNFNSNNRNMNPNINRNANQNKARTNQNMTPAANPAQNAQPSQPYNDPSVRYEPLDEKSLELLKGMNIPTHQIGAPGTQATQQQTAEGSSISQQPLAGSNIPPKSQVLASLIPQAAQASNPAETMERLRGIMQNEKNGSVFYEKLSKLSNSEKHSDFAIKLSEQCKKSQAHIRELQSAEFSIADMETISPRNFRDGILTAINEESAGIREILDMYERENEEKTTRFLNLMLIRKLCAINEMRGLL